MRDNYGDESIKQGEGHHGKVPGFPLMVPLSLSFWITYEEKIRLARVQRGLFKFTGTYHLKRGDLVPPVVDMKAGNVLDIIAVALNLA